MLKRTISGVILVTIMLFMIDYSSKTYIALWALLAFATVGEFAGLVVNHWGRLGRQSALIALLGAAYILLCYALLVFGFGHEPHNRMLVIMMMTIIWANDVGAYLIGSQLGRHKMAPRISPKKSWEGFAGGIIVAVAVAILWQVMFWSKAQTPVEMLFVDQWTFFILLGVVIALGSVVGDMLESLFKRKIGVKDSGNIIPGHGGVLDRFDALLMAVPLVWIYLKIML